MASAGLYIGLMSGTSMDGVDGVLARLHGERAVEVLAHRHLPMPAALGAELLALNTSGPDELHRAALAANALARLQGEVVHGLLAQAGVDAAQVRAVGSHGQTVRHRPREFDGTGYTWQLNAPALLAELAGIDVVADFRTRDVAAAGQGAPLVPAFHAAVFGDEDPATSRAVLNVGGIANLTLLPRDGRPLLGFDCGPGNVLMDLWSVEHLGRPYDEAGRWAAGGRVDPLLLARLLDNPFFRAAPPKSTGRDLFHREWLDRALAAHAASTGAAPAPQDVQATLLALTTRGAIDSLRSAAPSTTELLVCGGGAFNDTLMDALAAAWPGLRVRSTAEAGLPPLQVEAAAFAWLASACLDRRPGNHPAVTGAKGPRVLGAVYPR